MRSGSGTELNRYRVGKGMQTIVNNCFPNCVTDRLRPNSTTFVISSEKVYKKCLSVSAQNTQICSSGMEIDSFASKSKLCDIYLNKFFKAICVLLIVFV